MKSEAKMFGRAVIILILGLLFIFFPDKSKDYKENGIKTQVTITEKYGFRKKQYKGVFADETGKQFEVKVIPNEFGVYIGDVLVGYYMPDDPYTVMCCNSNLTRNIVRVMGVLFCFCGLFFILGFFKRT